MQYCSALLPTSHASNLCAFTSLSSFLWRYSYCTSRLPQLLTVKEATLVLLLFNAMRGCMAASAMGRPLKRLVVGCWWDALAPTCSLSLLSQTSCGTKLSQPISGPPAGKGALLAAAPFYCTRCEMRRSGEEALQSEGLFLHRIAHTRGRLPEEVRPKRYAEAAMIH